MNERTELKQAEKIAELIDNLYEDQILDMHALLVKELLVKSFSLN